MILFHRFLPFLVLAPLLLTGCAMPQDNAERVHAASASMNESTLTMAKASLAGGDIDSAKDLFDQAVKRDPLNMEARMGQGNVALLMGDVESARMSYADTAKRFPNEVEPQLALGRVAVIQRRLDQADQHYGKARLMAPSDPRP